MNKRFVKLSGSGLLLLWLAGCAAPSPYGGAPVVDRSVYRQPPQQAPAPVQPLPPAVQVTPLEPPTPLTPQVIDQPLAAIEPVPVPAEPAPRPAPVAPEPEESRAVASLLDSAANHVVNNELDQAASALERALRIEPRNATIWHDLGQVRLHQRSYDQAETMFEKSNSLAGGNRALQARNWRMIAASRRAGGNAMGADAAEAQAITLER